MSDAFDRLFGSKQNTAASAAEPDPVFEKLFTGAGKYTRKPEFETPHGRIIDGDTIALPNGQRVRFQGGDARELGNYGGAEARARAAELLNSEEFKLHLTGEKDATGNRQVGEFIDANGETLSNRLIREGYTNLDPRFFDHISAVHASAEREREFAMGGSTRLFDEAGPNNDITAPTEIYADWRSWQARAWERGKAQMLGNYGAMASAVGNLLGIEGMEEYGDRKMADAQHRVSRARPDIDTYEDVNGFTDTLKYIGETMMEEAPSTLTDIGIGLVAGATAPFTGGGSVVAAGAAMATRQAIMQTAKRRFAAGVAGSMYTQVQGDSYQHLLGAGVDKEAAAATSLLLTGPVNTALNYASFNYILGRMKIGDTSGAVNSLTNVLTESLKAAGVAAPTEGITELAQFTINEIASRHLNSDYEGATREEFIETTLRGMAGGGGVAGAGRAASATAQYGAGKFQEYQERVNRPTQFTPDNPQSVERQAADLRDGIGGRDTMIVHPEQIDDVRATIGSSRRDVREYQNEDGSFTVTTNPEITTPLNTNEERAKALDYAESLDEVPADAQAVVVRDNEGNIRFDEAVRIENLENEVRRLQDKYKDTDSTVEVMSVEEVQAERARGLEQASAQQDHNEEVKRKRAESLKAYNDAVLSQVDTKPAAKPAPTQRAKKPAEKEPTAEVRRGKPIEVAEESDRGKASFRDENGKFRPVSELVRDYASGKLSVDTILAEAKKVGVNTALIKGVETDRIDRYQVAKALVDKGIYPTGLAKDGKKPSAFDVARSKLTDKELRQLALDNKIAPVSARQMSATEQAAEVRRALHSDKTKNSVKKNLVELGIMENLDSPLPTVQTLRNLKPELLQQALWATGKSFVGRGKPVAKDQKTSVGRLLRAIQTASGDQLTKHKLHTPAPDPIAAAETTPSTSKDRRLIDGAIKVVDDFYNVDLNYLEDGDLGKILDESPRSVDNVLARMKPEELDTIAKEFNVDARQLMIDKALESKVSSLSHSDLSKALKSSDSKLTIPQLRDALKKQLRKQTENQVDALLKTEKGQRELLRTKVSGIRAVIRDALIKMDRDGVTALANSKINNPKIKQMLPAAKAALYDIALLQESAKILGLQPEINDRTRIIESVYDRSVSDGLEHLVGGEGPTLQEFTLLVNQLEGNAVKEEAASIASAREEFKNSARIYAKGYANVFINSLMEQLGIKTDKELETHFKTNSLIDAAVSVRALGRESDFYEKAVMELRNARTGNPTRVARYKGQSDTPPATLSDVEFHKARTVSRFYTGLTYAFSPQIPFGRKDAHETVNRAERFKGGNLVFGTYKSKGNGATYQAGMDAFTIVDAGREYVSDMAPPRSKAEMAAAFYSGLTVLQDAASEDIHGNRSLHNPSFSFTFNKAEINDNLIIGVDMDSGKPVTLGEANKAWADSLIAEDRMAQYDVTELETRAAELEAALMEEWNKIDGVYRFKKVDGKTVKEEVVPPASLPDHDRVLLNDWFYAALNYGEKNTAKIMEAARKEQLQIRVKSLKGLIEKALKEDKKADVKPLFTAIEHLEDAIYGEKGVEIAGIAQRFEVVRARLAGDNSLMTKAVKQELYPQLMSLSKLLYAYDGKDLAAWKRIDENTDAQARVIKEHNLKHLWKLRSDYIAAKKAFNEAVSGDFANFKSIYESDVVQEELGRGEVEAMAEGELPRDFGTFDLSRYSDLDYMLQDDNDPERGLNEIPDDAFKMLEAGVIQDLSDYQESPIAEHTDEVVDAKIANTIRAMKAAYPKDKRSYEEVLRDAIASAEDESVKTLLEVRLGKELARKDGEAAVAAANKVKQDRAAEFYSKIGPNVSIKLSKKAERLDSRVKGMAETLIKTAERALGMRVPLEVIMQSEVAKHGRMSADVKKRLLANLKEKGKDAGAYVHDSATTEGSIGRGYIVIPDNGKPIQQIVTFAHELGHAFFEAHLYRMDDSSISKLRSEFFNERGVKAKEAKPEDFVAFKEWAADQFAHFAFGSTEFRSAMQGMTNADGTRTTFKSQHPFAKLIRALFGIWEKLQGLLQYKRNETFQQYLHNVMRDFRANPEKTTTVRDYDDKTIYNLDPAKTMRMAKANAARVWKNKSFGGVYRMVYTQIGDYSKRLQQMLYQESNTVTETGNTGWEQQMKFLRNRWTAAVNTQFEGRKDKDLKQAVLDLRQGKMTDDARMIKGIVDKINKDAATMVPMHLRPNFMVEAFSSEELMGRTGEFHALVKKHFAETVSEPQISAMVNSLIYNDGITDFTVSPGKPVSLHANVDRLLANDAFYKEAAAQGFLLNSPQGILNHYATSLAKRVAWEKQFGGFVAPREGQDASSIRMRLLTQAHVDLTQPFTDAQLKKKAVELGLEKDGKFYSPNAKFHAEIDKIRAEHGQEGADHVTRLVRNAMGFDGRHMPNKLRNAQSWLITYLNTLVLAFSGVASIPEVGGGNIRGVGRVSLKDTLEIIADFKNSQRRAMDLGTVMADMAEKAMMESFGPDYQSPGQHKVHYWLFKLNGQQQIMRMSRTIATGLAERYLLSAAQDAAAGKQSGIDDLKKLNVSAAEVLAYYENGRQGSVQVEQSINQFVYESVVEPSRFESTTWGNNPYMKLAWHLKQFLYSYANVILLGAWRASGGRFNAAKNAGMGTIDSAVYASAPILTTAALLIPLAMAGQEIREFIQQRDRSKSMDGAEYSALIYSKMGGFGAFEIILNMQQAAEWGRSPLMSTTVFTSKLEALLDLGADGKLSQRELETKIRGLTPFFAQNANAWNMLKF